MINEPGSAEQEYKLAFESVFKNHFRQLHAYAQTILGDGSMAEEMVQQVFYKVWEKKKDISVHTSLKAYLYRSVYNECMNYLKHQKHTKAYQQHSLYQSGMDEKKGVENMPVELKELREKLFHALNQLPEQCRTIFQMSRFEELKYREIAAELKLSVKTVEAQVSKALKILRAELIEFLPILLLIYLSIKK